MKLEFSGIERRLERLKTCLLKLEPLRKKDKSEILADPFLQDIIERNLEVSAQACIDIAARIITIEQLEKPSDYHDAFIRLGHAGILPQEFAERLAPLAGFRNILVHEYLEISWDAVYENLSNLQDLHEFVDHVKAWLASRSQDRIRN